MMMTPIPATTMAPRAKPAIAPPAPTPRATRAEPAPILTRASDSRNVAINRNRCNPWR